MIWISNIQYIKAYIFRVSIPMSLLNLVNIVDAKFNKLKLAIRMKYFYAKLLASG